MRTCRNCRQPLSLGGARGPIPTYCSPRCRVAAHRSRKARSTLPASMTDRRAWVRRDGKRPIQLGGQPASSTDSSTWSTYADALASTAGDGLGVMLGDGLACWDLDHCLDGDTLTASAATLLASIEAPIWVERSLSGTGLHVFVNAPEARGWRRDGVEFYSRQRFIAVTGDRFTPQ